MLANATNQLRRKTVFQGLAVGVNQPGGRQSGVTWSPGQAQMPVTATESIVEALQAGSGGAKHNGDGLALGTNYAQVAG